jgi:glycosyltransferase involved in cell wall biosynthesis
MTIVGSDDRSVEHALEIRNLIAKTGLRDRIVLTGAVDDAALHEHYAQADLFVLASRFEGFGMVLTEALARGLPIVTTTGGAAAETVSDQAAVKVPPEDAAALGKALKRLIEDPDARQRLADAAWIEAQTLTRWDDTTRIIADVLRENGA